MPSFGLAFLWKAENDAQGVGRFIQNINEYYSPTKASVISVALKPKGASLYLEIDFSLYGRTTLNLIEEGTRKLGGRFVELLRLPVDEREPFKAQFLTPPEGEPKTYTNFKDPANDIQEHLASIAPPAVPPPTSEVTAEKGTASPASARAPAAPTPELRRGPRFSVVLDVEFKSEADFSQEYATNISKGGIFVRTGQKLETGATVGVKIKLPNGQLLQAVGIVSHRVDHPDSGGVGVKFSENDAAFKTFLERYVASLSNRLIKR